MSQMIEGRGNLAYRFLPLQISTLLSVMDKLSKHVQRQIRAKVIILLVFSNSGIVASLSQQSLTSIESSVKVEGVSVRSSGWHSRMRRN